MGSERSPESMAIMLSFYIPLVLSLHIYHEKWNCDHPRKYPKGTYFVCQWDENDIYKNKKGEYLPYRYAKADNYFERKARNKFWQRRHQGKE